MTTYDSRTWTAWHLHLASASSSLHDRVVSDVVGPVVDTLPDTPWFFIRYWQGGPHVRVRLYGLSLREAVRVEKSLGKGLEELAAPREDEDRLDQEQFDAQAFRLAAVGEEGRAARTIEALRPPGVYRA